jgi:hypothetical protein
MRKELVSLSALCLWSCAQEPAPSPPAAAPAPVVAAPAPSTPTPSAPLAAPAPTSARSHGDWSPREDKNSPRFRYKRLTEEGRVEAARQADDFARWSKEGLAHVEAGRWAEGRAALERALAIWPEEAALLAALGRAAWEEGRPALALGALSRAQRLGFGGAPSPAWLPGLLEKAREAVGAPPATLEGQCRRAMAEWFCAPAGEPAPSGEEGRWGECACAPERVLASSGGGDLVSLAVLRVTGSQGLRRGVIGGSQYLAVERKEGGWRWVGALTDQSLPSQRQLYHGGQLVQVGWADVLEGGGEELLARIASFAERGDEARGEVSFWQEEALLICAASPALSCWRVPTGALRGQGPMWSGASASAALPMEGWSVLARFGAPGEVSLSARQGEAPGGLAEVRSVRALLAHPSAQRLE